MEKKLRIIDFFKIIIFILILTIFVLIIVSKKIEKTTEINQAVVEQKLIIENYISNKQTSDNTKKLLNELKKYIKENSQYPNMVPTVEFYGKDNANKIIMYTEKDNKQKEYYVKEIENILNMIKSNDTYYITTEINEKESYITKVIIEYN
ncbi:MAG: hypothetical protein J6J60_06160 [Clostridia bacterium]|nr:hypothetical protein [Clostridia bacterium]